MSVLTRGVFPTTSVKSWRVDPAMPLLPTSGRASLLARRESIMQKRLYGDAESGVGFTLDGTGEHDILTNSGAKLMFDSVPTLYYATESDPRQVKPPQAPAPT